MKKSDLSAKIAEDTGMHKAEAARAVDALISIVTAALKQGESVTLTGFGTFEVRSRKPRTGRNPRTGAEIKIAASKVPGFKAGKALKDAVS